MSSCHERFLDIPDYPGYKIGDRGTIISYKRKVPRVLKPQLDREGNWMIRFQKNKKQHGHLVGRLVLLAFVGLPPTEHECCHGPRGRNCHHLNNLSWGTKSKNSLDRKRDGTDNRGEPRRGSKNGGSKLTEQNVLNIRAKYTAGETQSKIAKDFEIVRSTVSVIVNRKSWKHV